MNCPLCQNLCKKNNYDDPKSPIHYTCSCIKNMLSFSSYPNIFDPQNTIFFIYHSALDFIGGGKAGWKIRCLDKNRNETVIANGFDILTPQQANQLILRYQNLLAFS